MQLSGHKDAEIAKRIDIAATAIFHGMTADAVSGLDLEALRWFPLPPACRRKGRDLAQ
jgi:hypothetical protein